MPRFYFHVVDDVRVGRDDDGLDLPDLDAAKEVAVDGARDILAAEVRRGCLDLSWRIDVSDAAGSLVLTLPFEEAVERKHDRR